MRLVLVRRVVKVDEDQVVIDVSAKRHSERVES